MFKVNSALLICNSLIGLSLVLNPKTSSAETLNQSTLLAQEIVDGLPPAPPTFAIPELNLEPPSAAPNVEPPPQAERYLVFVNGATPDLLAQVRRIESGAFVQEHQGKSIIQVGLFNELIYAQQQVEILADAGISAEVLGVSGAEATEPHLNAGGTAASVPAPDLLPVAPIPAAPAPVAVSIPASTAFSFRETSTATPPQFVQSSAGASATEGRQNQVSQSSEQSGGEKTPYYVVIPGNSATLSEIANQVIRLGEGYGIANVVEEAERPLGQHVRVGPFTSRRSAAHWSRYFRTFGMDARIDYRR
jgi:hypothetical protein